MVRAEHVQAMKGWLVACSLAGGEVKKLYDKLLHDTEVYHNLVLTPMRECSEGYGMPPANSEGYGQAIQDDIKALRSHAVYLPEISINDLCDTAKHIFDKASQ